MFGYSNFVVLTCFMNETELIIRYAMPLCLFVGVNHHGQSIVFGRGLLSSETIESYKWLFQEFMVCMYGKAP